MLGVLGAPQPPQIEGNKSKILFFIVARNQEVFMAAWCLVQLSVK